MRTRNDETDWRWAQLLAVAVIAGLILLWNIVAAATPAQGQEAPTTQADHLEVGTFIDVPLTVIRGDPGEVVVVAVVPSEVGLLCSVTLTFTNNDPDPSLHPGNDVRVGPLVYADVENGKPVANPTRSFTAAGDIVVAVQLGDDGVMSGGLTVMGGCHLPPDEEPPPTPSTTLPPTVTTTTVQPGTTTSTEPPPVGGVPAGGGAMAVVSGQDAAVLWWGGGAALLAGAALGLVALYQWARGRDDA